MPADDDQNKDLYKAIEQTPTERLKNGVEKVDSLSSEEEEALERGGNLALRGTKRRVFRWCWVWGVGFCIALGGFFTLTMAVFLGIYVYQVYTGGTIESVIGALTAFIFGVFSTLAVEHLYSRAKASTD